MNLNNGLSIDAVAFPWVFFVDNLSLGVKEDIEKEKLVEPCQRCNFEPCKNSKICDFCHFWKP